MIKFAAHCDNGFCAGFDSYHGALTQAKQWAADKVSGVGVFRFAFDGRKIQDYDRLGPRGLFYLDCNDPKKAACLSVDEVRVLTAVRNYINA